MRIGLSCTTIEPAITQGKIDGIGMYTKNLYESLVQSGQTIAPYSFPNGKQPIRSAFPQGTMLPYSYTVTTLASLLSPISISLSGRLKNKIDLFHATDHMIPKLSHVPIIATIHDALMFKYPQWFYNTRFATLKKWARKKSLRWANHFITVSNAMVSELVEYCDIPAEKISVVYNGISPWWFEAVSAEDRNRLLEKLKLPEKFILFTGTLHPKKNLPRLIQAYLELPQDIRHEYHLVIVGGAGWDTQDSLAGIHRLTTQKCGRWLEYVSDEELRILFQSATAYLHPSLHEGFGLTLLQAFASHTPVLTSNITAMPEIAGKAAYLVDPYSIAEIKQGIMALLTQATLRDELIKKGIIRACEFSWEQCAEKTFNVYQTILN